MLSSTRSDPLPLITATMHSTVPIPKMTRCVEFKPCFTTCLLLFALMVSEKDWSNREMLG